MIERHILGISGGRDSAALAVHMRPTPVSLAACQSNVACTPCGPAISIRGRGRKTACTVKVKLSPEGSA